MVNRIKFSRGKQREFLDLVVERMSAVSLRSLLQFGVDTNYSSLKNYYTERRFLPEDLFDNLCHLAKIDVEDLDVEKLGDYWGQTKGGRIGKVKVKNKKLGK